MPKSVFRQKSLDRISSPDKLDDYIKVSTPKLWIFFGAIFFLLSGLFVWTFVGKVDVKLGCYAEVSGSKCYILLNEENVSRVKKDSYVIIGNNHCTITSISELTKVTEDFNDKYLYLAGFKVGDWAYVVNFESLITPDIYKCDILIESISPIKFVTN